MSIRVKDLVEFLGEVKAKEECPFCGNTDWIVLGGKAEDENLEMFWPQIYKTDGTSTERGLRILPIVCDHCGFARLQDAERIFKWKDERQKK